MQGEANVVQHVYGNTYCIEFRRQGEQPVTVPFYKITDKEIVLLDTGYSWTAEAIMDYVKENSLSVKAIIHSHLHIDHVSGDNVIYKSMEIKPAIYGPLKMVPKFRRYYSVNLDDYKKDPFNYRYLSEYMEILELLQEVMIEAGESESVTVGGEKFVLLNTPGHSQDHKAIINPDGVCYLGDCIMNGTVLEKARAPYCFNLIQDIESKRKLKEMKFTACVAAHEGWFTGDRISEIVEKNLDISRKILNRIADLEESEPSSEVIVSTLQLMDEIGFSRYRNAVWIVDTINQYYNYYKENHTRKLPGE